ncbi:uncharacterized protein C21orf62-like isoform X2 [Takifugu flavidus]|uniref:uncharacterized protein C21orf62-like isoform X2 n=1 Tax=Takifugu flavidus TaxID=433684 RepID=UPI002544AD61|nr:uncharacterized protein C21orf62-like isoform X2 [Takifugu flavidus]
MQRSGERSGERSGTSGQSDDSNFTSVTKETRSCSESLCASSISLLGEDVACLVTMAMAPNTACSALLPWPLWLFFLLAAVTQTTSPAPTPELPVGFNTTLLFTSAAPGLNLRNCSCSAPVRDCDEALANSLCRCRTVLRSSLPPAGLWVSEQLTVWVKEVLLLEELLNRSVVHHLQLSFCGIQPVDSRILALLGVRTLRITAPEAPYSRQEITIAPSAGLSAEIETASSNASTFHLTLLDVALFNGLSAMKAYTVVGPAADTLSQHFPHLPFPDTPPSGEPRQNLLLTFVY